MPLLMLIFLLSCRKTLTWMEMLRLVSDDMLDTFGVSGRPAEAGRKLRERNRPWANRTTPVLYNETDPDAVGDLVRGFKGE
jgi:hypothetical protein